MPRKHTAISVGAVQSEEGQPGVDCACAWMSWWKALLANFQEALCSSQESCQNLSSLGEACGGGRNTLLLQVGLVVHKTFPISNVSECFECTVLNVCISKFQNGG